MPARQQKRQRRAAGFKSWSLATCPALQPQGSPRAGLVPGTVPLQKKSAKSNQALHALYPLCMLGKPPDFFLWPVTNAAPSALQPMRLQVVTDTGTQGRFARRWTGWSLSSFTVLVVGGGARKGGELEEGKRGGGGSSCLHITCKLM